jgi:probable rRNA maturation factor
MNAKVEISSDGLAHWLPDEPLCENWINAALVIANMQGNYVISLRCVDESESSAINRQYRDKNSATNVLSFPATVPSSMSSILGFELLGDIVICPQVIALEANAQGKSLEGHWAHMLVHGLLHLLGYDHESPEEAEAMEKLEIKALERLGISNPYLLV